MSKDSENNLITGFTEADKNRVSVHLEKLLPYLSPDQFALVGGLAIRYHLSQRGIDYPVRPFNDLDIIAKDSSVVSPSVTNDFLVYHYHPQVGNSFYIVLVDPGSKTKIDIFNYDPAPKKLITVPFAGQNIQMVSPEDQLVKTVLDITRISDQLRVDPKQFMDAQLLLQIADLNEAEKIWREKYFERYQNSLADTMEQAQQTASAHPEWLKKDPFRKPNPYVCTDCQSTADFPITPMEEIYKVLGYIE
jgi:hypothetical protein